MSMKIQEVKLADIKGPAFRIRTETRELDPELVESIKTHGLKQPILLRPLKPPYQIVAGLKRFEAFKKLKYKTIPAIVEDLDNKTAYELMLTENIQRRNLTAMEEARAFREYLDTYKESIRSLARKINKSHAYIVQRLLMIDWMKELPIPVRKEIQKEIGYNVTTSHVEAMTRLEEPEKIREVARAIKEEKLSVPQTAEVVELVKEQKLPVERAVETVKIVERARESAGEVAEQLKEALVKATKEIRVTETSEGRRLMESYMFLGTILQSLNDERIFCLKHPHKKPMLEWACCHTPVSETHGTLKKKLGMEKGG